MLNDVPPPPTATPAEHALQVLALPGECWECTCGATVLHDPHPMTGGEAAEFVWFWWIDHVTLVGRDAPPSPGRHRRR